MLLLCQYAIITPHIDDAYGTRYHDAAAAFTRQYQELLSPPRVNDITPRCCLRLPRDIRNIGTPIATPFAFCRATIDTPRAP